MFIYYLFTIEVIYEDKMAILWIIDQICWYWGQIIELDYVVGSGHLLVETIQFNTIQVMDGILILLCSIP